MLRACLGAGIGLAAVAAVLMLAALTGTLPAGCSVAAAAAAVLCAVTFTAAMIAEHRAGTDRA